MKSFEIISNKIVASDPCYDLGTWCAGIIDNVKNGEWRADVEIDMGTISVLRISHIHSRFNNQELLDFDAGVDSGQFGFFDYEFYRNDDMVKDIEKFNFGADYNFDKIGDCFYRACCFLTLNEEQYGVLPYGVVSTSGYGDGSYQVVGFKNKSGEWDAFSIRFINDYEDDDYEDEDDDYEDE